MRMRKGKLKYQILVYAAMYSVQGIEDRNTKKRKMLLFHLFAKLAMMSTIITPMFPMGDGIGGKMERPFSTIFDSRNLNSGVSTSNKCSFL